MYKTLALTFALVLASLGAGAEDKIEVEMAALTAEGTGANVGTITARDSPAGLELIPDLNGLPPGDHGFHVHQEPDCGPAEQDGKLVPGLAAGGHFDPDDTGVHAGPSGKGHLGDLPVLTVGPDGSASKAVIASRLRLSDVKARALIVHAGGDNYSDVPEKLGGGGARVACGVIP